MSAKKSPKKKPQSRLSSRMRPSAQIMQAQQHMAHKQWEQAEDILKQVVRQQPSHSLALAMLGDVYAHMDDINNLWDVAEKLTQLEPDEPTHWVNLARASLVNNLPFSALHYANHFLTAWPDHELASEVRETQAVAEKVSEHILASESTTQGASAEDLMLFEQSQMAFNRGDVKRGEQIAQEASRRLPDAVAPLNNLALAYMLQGNLEKAVGAAWQALEREPGNVHALSNLAQSLFRMGRRDEAQAMAQQLRIQPDIDGVLFAKVLEAFATLGDDATVIEVYQTFEQSSEAHTLRMPTIHHLAAVSYARQGDMKRARALWTRAQNIEPHFAPARENLDDLKKPVEERSGAWPFALNHWIPQNWIEALGRAARKGTRGETVLKREIKRVLREIPHLESVLPILLERGDPVGRQTALMVAHMADLPVLRDFALSRYGTDQQRMEAAQHATELGLLPRGKPVPLTIKGELTELLLLAYEIYEKPQPSGIPSKAQRLLEQAHDALVDGHAETAETLAREALDIVPDNPTLLNFLASSLTLQRRKEEAAVVVKRTVELHPDYLFGCTAMAQLCIADGRVQEARDWLEPLLQRPRFHVSEFKAVCVAHVELLIAEKAFEGARSWLSFMEQVDPEDPNLSRLRLRLMGTGLLKKKK
ncbi:MAG: tetratricopeptide repeat protein [Anaerolineales bacterium]|nr:tetratricopeptide repeat protein [Anaerolineales bacterium]